MTPPFVDFYDSAFGPTIRIDCQSPADLIAVRQVFLSLASKGEFLERDLEIVSGARFRSIAALILRRVRLRPSKALKLDFRTAKGPVFSWSNIPDDWMECVLKIDPLLEEDSPGHQYLTLEGIDDALVELCYRESDMPHL